MGQQATGRSRPSKSERFVVGCSCRVGYQREHQCGEHGCREGQGCNGPSEPVDRGCRQRRSETAADEEDHHVGAVVTCRRGGIDGQHCALVCHLGGEGACVKQGQTDDRGQRIGQQQRQRQQCDQRQRQSTDEDSARGFDR